MTPDPLSFRRQHVSTIPTPIGVYALCDLDEVPIYVGKSTDGIQNRVRRHLTSARSDVIANRQVDVWEVAYVWSWPVEAEERGIIDDLEAHLFHFFHAQKILLNGNIPHSVTFPTIRIPPVIKVQVMTDEEIAERKNPIRRLPRQAEHFRSLVDHILNVKNSPELRRSLAAHYERLSEYYHQFLEI